jgi:hypothetical protein
LRSSIRYITELKDTTDWTNVLLNEELELILKWLLSVLITIRIEVSRVIRKPAAPIPIVLLNPIPNNLLEGAALEAKLILRIIESAKPEDTNRTR